MTPTDLPPGPETDARVAREVMGWHQDSWVVPKDAYDWYAGCTLTSGWLAEGMKERNKRDFQPSTNIAHAWEVVEHFEARGYQVVITNCGGCKDSAGKWAVDVVSDDDSAIGIHADTAPLAICRAALACVATRA